MLHLIEHTILDTLKIVPFLFVAFLFIEFLEHKFSTKTENIINKSGKFGPVLGSLLGIIPQCGFSVFATNLYITRVISVGTLIAVYLSTSDEMLPIMLSRNVDFKIILLFLLTKFICGIAFGFIIDLIIRKKNINKKFDYHICEEEKCDCEHGILKPVIKHTFNTLIYVFVITFFLSILFEYANDNLIDKIFLKNSLFGPLVGSLIGLIPNCASSIMLTELFLNNVINYGTCISGLLSGCGVSLILLFKTNKNRNENIFIVILLYLIGVLLGIFINFIEMVL